jgi:hypothetical protein
LLDLLVEFERLPRGVSPNVEYDEVIDIGLPKRSRCGDLFGSMDLDSMTPQDARAHPTGSLAAIDEENFLASKNRAATKRWWIIHTHTSGTRAPLWRGDSSGLCSRKEGKSTAIEKVFGAVLGLGAQALFLEVIAEKADQRCSTL